VRFGSGMIGQTLSHYLILEQIGAGGMGIVYRAHDERLDRDVALKILSPEFADDQQFIARFRREARALSKLNHPNVATVHDFDSQAGTIFIVMEYVQGTSTLEKIRRGPFAESEVINLALQLLDGLAAAHSQGIIHRDLKPGNLRETLDGRLKILDFGLARSLTADPDVTQSLPSTTGLIGTLPYMAPEQLRGEAADTRTDIYSAGAVLYELATGSRPFPDNFAPRLTDSILHRIPISPRELNAGISIELDSVILTALEKDPRRRFDSAQMMHTTIELIQTNSVSKAASRAEQCLDRPAQKPTRSDVAKPQASRPAPSTAARIAFSLRSRILMALAIVIVALSAVGFWIFRNDTPIRKRLRPSVAVIGFKNHTASPDSEWISTSLSDMLASELAAGDHIVTTPAESVARMRIDLGLPNEASYAAGTVQRIKRSIHCDYIVFGSFFASGRAAGGHVTLDFELRDAKTGEEIARFHDSGIETALPELAARAGASLRAKLNLPAISATESTELQAAVPSTSEASRLYFLGLAQLRSFDLLGARESLSKAVSADPNFSLGHAYLAQVWSALGYDDKARVEAKTAFELSSHLSREDKTLVEARFREISSEWDKAADLYRSLWTLYPENPEYAIRAADAQIRAGNAKDALKTIAVLRQQSDSGSPDSIGNDPRLDLKEAEAAEAVSDFTKEKQSALRAADVAASRGSRLLQAEALWRACAAMASLGELQSAQSACRSSISISKPAGDLLLVARASTILGMAAASQGDTGQSLEQHRQAMEFARKIGSRRDIAGALINIGNALADQGDLTGAQKSYENALAEAEEINDRGQIVTLLNNLATISQTLGRFPAALRLYQQSLDEARAIQDKGSIARAQSNIAFIDSLQGNFPAALQNIQQAVRTAEETGHKGDQAQFLYVLGDIHLDQGEAAIAELNYQSGLQLATAIGDKSVVAVGRLSLARLRLEAGRSAEAEILARQAVEEFKSEGLKSLESSARNLLASAFLALDRPSDALSEMDVIGKLSTQDPTIRLAVAITAGRLQIHSGKTAAGKIELDHAADQAAKLGIPGLKFEARLAQGETAFFGGDKHDALSLLSALQKEAARKGFKQIEARALEVSKRINTSKGTG
jgi:serine/threonine protein kinase/tetratricopeptide (TPR) repeat protein